MGYLDYLINNNIYELNELNTIINKSSSLSERTNELNEINELSTHSDHIKNCEINELNELKSLKFSFNETLKKYNDLTKEIEASFDSVGEFNRNKDEWTLLFNELNDLAHKLCKETKVEPNYYKTGFKIK